MSEKNGKSLMRGMLAGVGAGLAASWAMNLFMAGPGEKLQEVLETEEDRYRERLQAWEQERSGEPKQDATMKAADAITAAVTGGQHLSMDEQQAGGSMVHYAFGALMGGLYGGLAEYSRSVRTGFGTAFGSVLFAGADLVAVPAFKLSPPLSESSPKSLANPYTAHLVYGATTELMRRVLRAVL
ncbi:MAG TPA: DUF1440 domain-containing protein [Acidobacteriaceae bacterium]|nr:DUF1440 domain-containing protein [Acidobacteriaceae bacterium]